MPRLAAAPLRTPAKRPPPLQPRRPSRLTLLWRRRRRLLFPAAVLLLLVVLLGAGASLVRSLRPSNTVATLGERIGVGSSMVVQDIRIQGLDKTPEPLLRAALGISRGDRLLGFSLEAARTRIESLAWVQRATVERRLPGTVVVTIEERRPFAVWQNGGKFQLIDRAGQVVERQDPAKDAAAFASLPLVVGTGAPDYAAALLDDLAAQPALRARVSAAIRVGERRWTLHLKNGADVLLPEGAEALAMARLVELQTSQALLDRPLQTVDMRLPDRLVVRPADARPSVPPPATASPRRPT